MRYQKSCELFPFVKLLGELGCRTYLEVGAKDGQTFLAIGSTMQRAVAIDLGGSSARGLLRRSDTLRTRLGIDSHVILGNSRNLSVIDQAAHLGPYDAVFIDGDHTYDGVLADFTNYVAMADKLVAFHDILPNYVATTQVSRLWGELKAKRRTAEFCERWGNRPMGIGVVLL